MAHPTEEAAFESYVSVFPSASILLIDTYDTRVGAARAAAIARDKLKGVRIDSGDLGALSVAVRKILDDAGCTSAKIVASGDLNELRIAELRRAGAPIDLYGVGTDLVTSIDAPSLGGVYKLVELSDLAPRSDGGGEVVERRPIAKFSDGKATLPGAHQVQRFRDAAGVLVRDVIALETEALHPEAEPLLVPVMKRGARVASGSQANGLGEIRARVGRELSSLPAALRRLEVASAPGPGFAAEISPRLAALVETVRARVVPTRETDGGEAARTERSHG
jgi:nicotinate phosphoribosyltransferase